MLRSGHLNDDAAYVQAMASQSEFPYKYRTEYAPWNACPISNCNKQFRVGPYQVGTWNELVESTPIRVLEHGNRSNTELFGTAPFRARGDGHLAAPAISNELMRKPVGQQRCARPLSEIDYDRFQFNVFPNNAEWWRRGGESARMGPVYVQAVPFPS